MFAALALMAAAALDPEAAVRCAALWSGYADAARVSAYLDGEDAALQEAGDFRGIAIGAGMDRADVARGVAEQRDGMFLMVRAAIRGDDRASRDLFERQMALCDTLKIEAGE